MTVSTTYPGLALSDSEIAGIVQRFTSMRGTAAVTAVAIALRETGGTGLTNLVNDTNSNGTIDRGIVQWNASAHPDISDAEAFDPVEAFRLMDAKSSGGSNFGAWALGPNSYTDDRLPALQQSAYWRRAQVAVSNPRDPTARVAAYRFASGASGTGASSGNDHDAAALARWDRNNDGKLDGTDRRRDLEGKVSTAGKAAIHDVIEDRWKSTPPRAGWYDAAMTAGRAHPASGGDPAREAWMLSLVLLARGGILDYDSGATGAVISTGGLANTPGAIGGAVAGLPGAALDAAGNVLGAITPSWAEPLGRFLGALTNVSFWRAVGVGALGLGLVLVAILVANRDSIAKGVAGAAVL